MAKNIINKNDYAIKAITKESLNSHKRGIVKSNFFFFNLLFKGFIKK